MDDVFDEHADERALGLNEIDRLREQFHTMGLKEGILQRKDIHDEEIVGEYFVKGFNETIGKSRVLGKLSMIEYILLKLLPSDHKDAKEFDEALTDLVNKMNNNQIAEAEEGINKLLNRINSSFAKS